MSEIDEKKVDDVNKATEENNKLVSAMNIKSAENEELKKQIEELKKEKETEKKTEDGKKDWEKAKEETDKQIEELKKAVEEKKTVNKVAKGIVTSPEQSGNNPAFNAEEDAVMKKIKEQIPDRQKNPEKFASNLARFQHYASPITKAYDDKQLGMALSLHAGVNRTSPHIIGGTHSNYARSQSHTDIVFRQKPTG